MIVPQNTMPSYISPCGLPFLERSCGRRRPDADRELPHEVEQAFRLLDLRQVASFGDWFEASVGERLGIDTTIFKVCHAIALSPGNENWDFHMPEATLYLWITAQPLA